MTTAEGDETNCPQNAASDEEWIRRRLDEALKVVGSVKPDASSEVERLLRSDLSDRQLRSSELSAIARHLLSLMCESVLTDEN